MLDKISVICSTRRWSLLTRLWRRVWPCFSSPTASCVRYTLKNILFGVIMTPGHRMNGRAAWNVVDLVDTKLVNVREAANLLRN